MIGFEPPTIGGGTAYSLANLSKFQEAWKNLEVFQQHVFRVLTGGKSLNVEVSDVDDLSSERFGANYYAKLRDLIAVQDWKAADQETLDRMCELVDRQKEKYLSTEYNKLPCQDLRNIDRLWVKYSKGKFGLSVQKKIWESCGSPTAYDDDWERFGIRVGWRTKGVFGIGAKWKTDAQLLHSESPTGHLPSRGIWVGIFSRIQNCEL